VMAQLAHPNVAALVGLVHSGTAPTQLLVAFYEHGTLLQLLRGYAATCHAEVVKPVQLLQWSRTRAKIVTDVAAGCGCVISNSEI